MQRSKSLALEAYRFHALTAAQLRRLLGFETHMQVDAFLKEHDVYDFTAEDFERDRETLRQLRAREGPVVTLTALGSRSTRLSRFTLTSFLHAPRDEHEVDDR